MPLFTLQTESQIMKFNQRRQFVQVALFPLMALGAGTAFAQAERGAPGLPSPSSQTGAVSASALVEQVDLGEVSRGTQEVSRFLAQPKLAEALVKAKSDKSAGAEAAKDGNAYLAKQGIQVPANTAVLIKSPVGGGGAFKIRVEVEISYPPLKGKIIIHL